MLFAIMSQTSAADPIESRENGDTKNPFKQLMLESISRAVSRLQLFALLHIVRAPGECVDVDRLWRLFCLVH